MWISAVLNKQFLQQTKKSLYDLSLFGHSTMTLIGMKGGWKVVDAQCTGMGLANELRVRFLCGSSVGQVIGFEPWFLATAEWSHQ